MTHDLSDTTETRAESGTPDSHVDGPDGRARATSGALFRRDCLRALGGAVGTAGALTAVDPASADPSDEHYHNPVGPFGMGDPTVFQWEDGTYYAYGTHRHFARSTDLVEWEDLSPVVDWEPDWHGDPEAGFWAPDVNYFNDQVYLYYSHSTWGSQDNPGIGVATADHPEGPFTDHGPVFRDEDLPYTNCIDSDLVVEDGTPYLIWGSFFGIWGVELTPDGMDFVPGTEFQLAGDNREGPMIVRENGYYYLFHSTGHCCDGADSTYEVEVGRSESLFGPYYTRDGRDLRDIQEHHAGQTVLTASEQFVSPGHNTAIQDDAGDWWMLYHVEATAEREGRIMMIDRIRFDDDDWPVVGCDGTPCAEAPRPTIGDVGPEPVEPPALDTVELNGRYRIENVESDAALSIEGGSAEGGASVVQRGYDGAPDQHWTIEHLGDGVHRIENEHSGLSLDVLDFGVGDGTDVIQWEYLDGENQRFLVGEDADGGLVLAAQHSGRVLEVFEASTEDGANVVQWEYDGGANQQWRAVPVEDEACGGAADAGTADVDGQTVCDLDGDGLHRDVTGDGTVGQTDVVQFFERQHRAAWKRPDLFDFSGNGAVGHGDVIELFEFVAVS